MTRLPIFMALAVVGAQQMANPWYPSYNDTLVPVEPLASSMKKKKMKDKSMYCLNVNSSKAMMRN